MFNWTMLRYVGEDGVAAVTIIMYVLMFASSLYTGYSYGVAPMISYYFGEQRLEAQKGTAGFAEPRSGKITGTGGEEPDCAPVTSAVAISEHPLDAAAARTRNRNTGFLKCRRLFFRLKTKSPVTAVTE